MRSFKISQKLYFGFGIITILMLFMLGYAYMNFKEVSKVVNINLSTYQLLRESDGILTSLVDMETGSRGYTITGDDKFLEPFNVGKADFYLHYNELKRLISKNQVQQHRLENLKKEYEIWFDFESDIIAKKRTEVSSILDNNKDIPSNKLMSLTSSDKNVIDDLIRSSKGRFGMDNMRSILTAIANEETRLLWLRSQNLKDTEIRTHQAIIIGGVTIIILAISIAFFTTLSIIKPIKMLILSTENITIHNYKRPIKLKADRDLEALIKNFNAMQVAIQIREDELSEKNEAIKIKMTEAKEANRLKSQFLANMSHELRTPLNSIIGFTTRVMKKSKDNLSSNQLDNLKTVKEEAYRLLDLINNLLDYSKMEAGKMSLYMETFDLVKVIEQVNNIVSPLIAEKALEYKYEFYTNENIMITSDQVKIKHILINLLSNAIKFSEKGTIQLSVEKIDYVYCLKLEDQGIGIAFENINNIFDEFQQVDGSHTRKIGGTGLGLSITKKFIEMLEGKIEATSTLGKGSCFTVYFPIEPSSTNDSYVKLRGDNISLTAPSRNVLCVDNATNGIQSNKEES